MISDKLSRYIQAIRIQTIGSPENRLNQLNDALLKIQEQEYPIHSVQEISEGVYLILYFFTKNGFSE
jgi:hypothetical protein